MIRKEGRADRPDLSLSLDLVLLPFLIDIIAIRLYSSMYHSQRWKSKRTSLDTVSFPELTLDIFPAVSLRQLSLELRIFAPEQH